MKDANCGYCMGGDLLDAFGIPVCHLSVSDLILFKEQSHPGRCIVAYKDHVSELVDLSDADRDAFFADVAKAAKAIHAVFHPNKVNYGAYGDTGCHLHVHLVPKYKDEFEWGGVFAMNPGQTYLSDEAYQDMIAKLKAARDAGKPIDGHFPMGSGLELAAYAAEGISSDHECNDAKEACDKLAAGMDVFIRQGSAGKQLLDILPAVNKDNISHFSLCTDDCHAADILKFGHINHVVAQAVAAGMSAADAVRLATLNPAEHYKLNCGAIEVGRQADIIFVPDLVGFKPNIVFKRGVMVAAGGKALFKTVTPDCAKVKNTLHMPPVTKEKLKLKGSSLTYAMKIKAGSLVKDMIKYKEGLPKLCVAERHKKTGRVGVCAIFGYPIKRGAVAISISHDSHNVVCAGDNDKDMCLAINSLMPAGGGVCAVKDGKIHLLPLPVAGLMTCDSAEELAGSLTQIEEFCKTELNLSSVTDPVMTLSFLALTVIPHVSLTDRGLFDCDKFCFV